MRKRARPSLNETQQTLLRPLEESERILCALGTMSTRLGRPLNEERIKQWMDDLANYPVEAIEWSLDTWARNGRQLPTLADLLQLLRTWQVDVSFERPCECEDRHGKGYGTNDILWLWKRRQQSGKKDWTSADYEAAMQQLDKVRAGGAPGWREAAR